jgi:hypothetical protein
LVLCGTIHSLTFWARSSFSVIDEACENLWLREGEPKRRSIHYTWGEGLQTWNHRLPELGSLDVSSEVGDWLATVPEVECAVWTGLPPRDFDPGETDIAHRVIEHLRGLDAPVMRRAKEYIQLAPETVSTPVRTAIEESLGWLPRQLPANLFDEEP